MNEKSAEELNMMICIINFLDQPDNKNIFISSERDLNY